MGQYYLLEKIAQGGMAEIYKGIAYDLHGIKRTVVIKKILPHVAANKEFIDMLVAEAKIAVLLTHGNIAQIFDLGKSGDDYFIVMEYVDGKSVSQIQRALAARSQPMPIPIACAIASDIAAGLAYMHECHDERGQLLHIIHRDVSPQNVLISFGGSVKIIDFGIAKARTQIDHTDVGVLKGKFAYMSPEHASGDPIDHRSDLFSLGVILYEMLTGRRLFKAKDNKETLRNVRRAVVALPSGSRADIPPELDRIVMRLLAKVREERYQLAATVRSDLLQLVHRQYPDFRSQALEEFIASLFVHPRGSEPPEREKTPLLIVDHTQSAIAVPLEGTRLVARDHAPAVMSQFMLPDDLGQGVAPDATDSPPASASGGQPSAIVEMAGDEPSATMAVWQWNAALARLREALRHPAVRPVAWSFVSLAVVAAVLWNMPVWRHAPPGWWQTHVAPHIAGAGGSASLPATPVHATARITSTPAGAAIYLDDRETGLRTPAELTDLQRGKTYGVGLHLAQYKYWRGTITAGAAPAEIAVALEMDYGRLDVVSRPAGAEVVMNGEVIGQTPLTRGEIVPGTVATLVIRLAGYRPTEKTVRIQGGATTGVQVVLERERKHGR